MAPWGVYVILGAVVVALCATAFLLLPGAPGDPLVRAPVVFKTPDGYWQWGPPQGERSWQLSVGKTPSRFAIYTEGRRSAIAQGDRVRVELENEFPVQWVGGVLQASAASRGHTWRVCLPPDEPVVRAGVPVTLRHEDHGTWGPFEIYPYTRGAAIEEEPTSPRAYYTA